ncbi:MCE family protein [Mycobacterium sp. E1747]|uniref:MCE family protein n=1 Tax=Mycobacterium sp. E1747 TaxID=1834128 RepID=UPI0007FE6248|nr:MlaD family protein [Mycobacterium sp. E1747]OBH08205.1 mammalian cell entry protein [Mycobacterium sp. E1747]
MRLNRLIRIQLTVFVVVSLVAASIMIFGYLKAPALLFGIGRYTVTMQLPRAAGLYQRANVTYRGTEVGRVTDVRLTDTDVAAVLSLKSGINIPADVEAQVHSQAAIGEQYVELVPRSDRGPALRNGDVIPLDHTTVPPDISTLLDATHLGLQAIPHDDLKTVIDESYLAVGGLGPELSRLVRGSTALAIDARAHQDELTSLIDQSKPVLDSQADSADAIRGWAAHLATITRGFQGQDAALAGILRKGPAAADEARSLIERLQPTLPIVLANLVSVGQVALTYQPNLEQLLVLTPEMVAELNAVEIPNLNTKNKGAYLAFDLNVNLPPPCLTGYLPPQQQRTQVNEDYPDRPAGDLYCRVPQDSPIDVRGARNLPCETRPGKRAPTVKMCESDENYVPLNDGFNWKGDPNATLSGQDIPQLAPGSVPAPASPATGAAPPPIAAAEYDPATGTYYGPDGHAYTQSDLAQQAPKHKTWQSMLIPPTG